MWCQFNFPPSNFSYIRGLGWTISTIDSMSSFRSLDFFVRDRQKPP
ncbi:hypothetical protein [Dapis sp. BLCC M126]